jgi:hypothetical protein
LQDKTIIFFLEGHKLMKPMHQERLESTAYYRMHGEAHANLFIARGSTEEGKWQVRSHELIP